MLPKEMSIGMSHNITSTSIETVTTQNCNQTSTWNYISIDLNSYYIAYYQIDRAAGSSNMVRKQYTKQGSNKSITGIFQVGTTNDRHPPAASAQPPGLSLRLKQGEDVTLPDRALDVPHDETVLVIQELHSDLGHLTPRASAAHHLDHDRQLNLGIHAAQQNQFC
jgi:hypothetical protein